MIKADDFISNCLKRGYNFWTGVPCSILTPLINCAIGHPEVEYVGASSEGEAVAIAIGAHLAGRRPVVICQNSGLGNMVNPITSLVHPLRIPFLMIVTRRGAPGVKDAPQHTFMGSITTDLLDVLKIPWEMMPETVEEIPGLIRQADSIMQDTGLPYALVMGKGTMEPCPLEKGAESHPCTYSSPKGEFSVPVGSRMKRMEAIGIIRGLLDPEDLVVGTTGKTSRELFSLGHLPNQFYVVGGLGCASGIGLGLSLNLKKRRVVVLDGDGGVLMKMGSLATIGFYRPPGLIHILLDNEAHESTGGQGTCSAGIDFAGIAAACSYRAVFRCDTADSLGQAVTESLSMDGPVMIHVKIVIGSDPDLPRPNRTPEEYKEEFQRFIQDET